MPQKGNKSANTVRATCLSRRAILETEGETMKPIELKKLRSTKREPQSYFAFMPPFRAEGNAVLDRNGYFVAQYWDTVIFMANGNAYNISEVIAEGVNRLVESEAPSF